MSINVDNLERFLENTEEKVNTPVKKLIKKGKPSTQSIVDDCMGDWELSENDNNNDGKKKNEF